MEKYKTMLQETLRLYDNPLSEEDSKLVMSYLRFYNYNPEIGVIRYKDRTYRIDFKNNDNSASLHLGKDLALLTEFDGHTEASILCKMDFIKKERMEYFGDIYHKCLVYTKDNFSRSFYYGPNHFIDVSKADYYNCNLGKDAIPDDFKDLSDYDNLMMRIVVSADYANEIRASRFTPPAYYGRQY